MKKIVITAILAITAFMVIPSCGGESKNESIQNVGKYTPKKVNRLDKTIYEYSKSGNQELLNDSITSYGVSAVNTMLNMGHPDDSAFVKYVGSDVVKIFTPEVEKLYSNLDELENLLGGVEENMIKELDGLKLCDIYSIVSSNRHHSIYMSDSTTMLLVLNQYLGKNHDAYKGFDEYIKANKESIFMPYDIVEAYIANTKYAFVPNGTETLLNRMLYQGALVEAKMRLVPGASMALALGYSDEQFKWLEDNEQKAWDVIVSKNLLYSTAPSDVDQLLSPAPATTIINANAPGRAGRYFGYKIVKAYLDKNPKTTLPQLFSPEFYADQQSFITSGYQGK
ncbi:MAG: hypothetical protein II990_06105 [Muribaculaceae bacterium]|nr:hypothetical protein [Muribaculaceae bacterium]